MAGLRRCRRRVDADDGALDAGVSEHAGALYGFAVRPPRRGPIKAPTQVATTVEGLWLASSYAGSGGYSGAMGGGAAAARAALKAEASA